VPNPNDTKPLNIENLCAASVKVLRLVERPDGDQALAPARNCCENGMCGACVNCLTEDQSAAAVGLAGRVVELERELEGTRADHRIALEGLQRALADERLNTQSADREARNLRHDLEVARREAGQQRERALEAGERQRAAEQAAGALSATIQACDAALNVAGVPSGVSVGGKERVLTLPERVKTLALRMVRAELELGDLKAKAHAARLVGLDGQALVADTVAGEPVDPQAPGKSHVASLKVNRTALLNATCPSVFVGEEASAFLTQWLEGGYLNMSEPDLCAGDRINLTIIAEEL
jgi:hypothetical protein